VNEEVRAELAVPAGLLMRLETSSEDPGAVAAMRAVGFTEYGRLPFTPGRPAGVWHEGSEEVLL
jgi:hypothetical protein